jgi:hypothetical protein
LTIWLVSSTTTILRPLPCDQPAPLCMARIRVDLIAAAISRLTWSWCWFPTTVSRNAVQESGYRTRIQVLVASESINSIYTILPDQGHIWRCTCLLDRQLASQSLSLSAIGQVVLKICETETMTRETGRRNGEKLTNCQQLPSHSTSLHTQL